MVVDVIVGVSVGSATAYYICVGEVFRMDVVLVACGLSDV